MTADTAWLAGGLLVLFLGLAIAGAILSAGVGVGRDLCHRCRGPLWPNGYEAWNDGRPVCRLCCRAMGLRPWYLKDWQGDDGSPRGE